MELTSEQIRFVKGRVSQWIRFYHDLGRNPTDGDAWHSASRLGSCLAKNPWTLHLLSGFPTPTTISLRGKQSK